MTENAPETALDKTFDPARIEAKWYDHWEKGGLFRPERPNAQPFTIVNPPPNVTGSLHIGHALDNTLQDVVIRYERLRGKDALWVVGTDHAGIATQMVVERQMEAKQDKRTNYTRDAFIEKVWEWKAESGGTITRQLRRLGCSMDWSREQFTMDPHFTKAVVKVFVDLYNQGLIYRDKRLVNWDPKLKTAISDLEVETREVQGSFWHFRYPLSDGSGFISVATTRPETMLADMAVAVNPNDDRYKPLLERGATVTLPITGREIPIVADEHADPELGSGAVKITPGHDFNDFEVGKRAGFKPADMLNMLDAEAKVCQTADGLIPEKYLGQDRFDAREMVVAEMKELGFLIPHVTKDKEGNEVEHDAEPRTIQTPYGDRGGVVIEPWLTDQWYVDAEKLAAAPIEAVKSGAIEIVPKTWEKTFFNWMENIQPWCVSRQLWWGHRIPAWYAQDGEVFVAETEAAAQALAGNKTLIRDEDVLDTWFSSALWPFATLGWPDETPPSPSGEGLGVGGLGQAQPVGHAPPPPRGGGGGGGGALGQAQPVGHSPTPPLKGRGSDTSLLSRHYPNDLLISGFDILFFWDARMAMQGIHFMKDVPWKRLYLHGLVRAADGQKMSKSKGNVVDPLGLIDKYGADALRFFMAAMESQGRDVKMDEKRVEGYRNFATKLWNAARFCQSNGIGASTSVAAPTATLAVNKWIIGEVVETLAELDKAMADLRFDAAANAIYHFVWDQFCDWYLERIKPTLTDEANVPPYGPQWAKETREVAGWVLDQILVMLHPFMPFITEELWSKMGARKAELIVAQWPRPDAKIDPEAKASMEWFIKLVSGIRAAKNELGIAPGAPLTAFVQGASQDTLNRVNSDFTALRKLARLNVETNGATPSGASVQIVVDEATFLIPLEGVIDIAAEKARLEKALAASQKERDSLAKRLENPAFVEKAKPEAVEKARADHTAHAAEAERLAAALQRLG